MNTLVLQLKECYALIHASDDQSCICSSYQDRVYGPLERRRHYSELIIVCGKLYIENTNLLISVIFPTTYK